MKIIHVVQCAGGVDRYLSMLLPLLKEAGLHQILICSYDYKKDFYKEFVDEVEQLDLKQSFVPWIVLRNLFFIRQLIKKHKPDIVYCHSSVAGGLGRLACIGMPIKVIYNPHGWAFNMH